MAPNASRSTPGAPLLAATCLYASHTNCLAQMGRVDEATTIFKRLVGLANDVGLLSEEYDRVAGASSGTSPRPSPTSA